MITPLLADLGPWEIIIIVGVLILLFGAKKLPELARGSGQALRIFKAETKELRGSGATDEPTDGATDGATKSAADQEIGDGTEAELKAERERHTDTAG